MSVLSQVLSGPSREGMLQTVRSGERDCRLIFPGLTGSTRS